MSERWTPEEETHLQTALTELPAGAPHSVVAETLNAFVRLHPHRNPGSIYTHLTRAEATPLSPGKMEMVRVCVRRLQREERARKRTGRHMQLPTLDALPTPEGPSEHDSALMADPDYRHFHETFVRQHPSLADPVPTEIVETFGTTQGALPASPNPATSPSLAVPPEVSGEGEPLRTDLRSLFRVRNLFPGLVSDSALLAAIERRVRE